MFTNLGSRYLAPPGLGPALYADLAGALTPGETRRYHRFYGQASRI